MLCTSTLACRLLLLCLASWLRCGLATMMKPRKYTFECIVDMTQRVCSHPARTTLLQCLRHTIQQTTRPVNCMQCLMTNPCW